MKVDETTLFKVLGDNGEAFHGGTGTWSLPDEDDRPGAWMPKIARPAPCERGYHLVTARQMLEGAWFGPRVFVAEARGERVDADNKSVHEQVRLVHEVRQWNDRTARLFACLCAERVLPIYEKMGPSRAAREAIATARRFADGLATRVELDAAGDAARDAAGDAASAAAWDAAWAAAWAAAGDAARDAAGDAASAAAWAAAGDAARAAAGDAASAAAWAAAGDWQTARLLELFNAEGEW